MILGYFSVVIIAFGTGCGLVQLIRAACRTEAEERLHQGRIHIELLQPDMLPKWHERSAGECALLIGLAIVVFVIMVVLSRV